MIDMIELEFYTKNDTFFVLRFNPKEKINEEYED